MYYMNLIVLSLYLANYNIPGIKLAFNWAIYKTDSIIYSILFYHDFNFKVIANF